MRTQQLISELSTYLTHDQPAGPIDSDKIPSGTAFNVFFDADVSAIRFSRRSPSIVLVGEVPAKPGT